MALSARALLAVALAGTTPTVMAGDLLGMIDPALSRAEFVLRVAWVRRLEGRFEYVQGTISHPVPDHFDVDVKIATQSLVMKNEEHAQWARSPEFFDSQRYPWIAFEARGAPRSLLTDGGELEGLLSLRGVTRPARFELLPSACERPGIDCAIEARGEVQRSEFGMDAKRWAVADKVRLALSFRVRAAEPDPAT